MTAGKDESMAQTMARQRHEAPQARGRRTPTPSIEEVRALAAASAGRVTTIPIVRETMADLETPVSAFLKVSGNRPAFLLESFAEG